MINFDNYTNEYKTELNSKWPYIPDHLYRTLITGGFRSGKTNALSNLKNNQLESANWLYLYAKIHMKKYQFLINKRESTGLKHFNDPIAFIEYLNDMQDVYKNME